MPEKSYHERFGIRDLVDRRRWLRDAVEVPLPDARVEAPVPLHRRRGVRKAAKVLAIIASLWGVVSYVNYGNTQHALDSVRRENTAEGYRNHLRYDPDADPDDLRGDLAQLHDAARARIRGAGGRPHGLDAFLGPLLARVDYRVRLDVSAFHVDTASFDAYVASLPPAELAAPHLPGSLDMLSAPGVENVPAHLDLDSSCAQGMNAVLAAVTGNDVIDFEDASMFEGSDTPAQPRVEVHAIARASGNAYVTGLSRQIVPGVRLVGELVVVGESGELGRVRFDAAPADEVRFTTIGGTPFGASPGDMVSGMIANDCSAAALALVRVLDGVAPRFDAAGSGSDS